MIQHTTYVVPLTSQLMIEGHDDRGAWQGLQSLEKAWSKAWGL